MDVEQETQQQQHQPQQQLVHIKMIGKEVGTIDLKRTALLIIDMQRDFLEPGGFGEQLGNDVTKLQKAIEPCRKVLEAARSKNMLIIHTQEGHRSDMSDVHPHKNITMGKDGILKPGPIGQPSPLGGRTLIRGSKGHDIIPTLYPQPNEPIIDKPGKGSFYATDLHTILIVQNIRTLLICGVTTEVCVQSTVREANDRGYHCVVLEDATASFNDEFHDMALKMIVSQGGIFGSVSDSESVVMALSSSFSSSV